MMVEGGLKRKRKEVVAAGRKWRKEEAEKKKCPVGDDGALQWCMVEDLTIGPA